MIKRLNKRQVKIKYEDFIKENNNDHKHEYGCVMLGLDCPEWK